MREAVIVSTARTPIGRAYKGAFNTTPSPTLAAHAIKAAVARAGVDGAAVDDVILGAAMGQGVQWPNIGRLSALASGLPDTVAGMSIDRQCSSGLMAVATGAKQIMFDDQDVVVAGGVESISIVQNAGMRFELDEGLIAQVPNAYMPMLDTAETVAARYNITRDASDAYALQSQQRTAAAQEAGIFDEEIISVSTTKSAMNRETGQTRSHRPQKLPGRKRSAGSGEWQSPESHQTKWESDPSLPFGSCWQTRASRSTTSNFGNSTKPSLRKLSTAETNSVSTTRSSM
jgi:acetyl-CoA C-acetyltransferase